MSLTHTRDKLLHITQWLGFLYRDLTPLRRGLAFAYFLFFMLYDRAHAKDPKSDTWIIGEARGACTLDNGYHFFNYCRNVRKRDTVFFAISKSSPHYAKLSHDANTLIYGSIRHIRIYLRSKVCLYTHTYSDFIYREHYVMFHKFKRLVFLHHGVVGFKKFDNRYLANSHIMDLATVGSAFEKIVFSQEIGIPDEVVKVTGYPRFDSLNDHSKYCHPQIVYMPTHRDWLKVPEQEFRETDFFRCVNAVIRSEKLRVFLDSSRVRFKLCLHPMMQGYARYFPSSSRWITIVQPGEEGPQQLIRDSHLLITDYSSVAWDFMYLGKPVIFYRFDIDKYMKSRGSYISLTDTRFGSVCTDVRSLIDRIVALAANGGWADAEPRSPPDESTLITDGRSSERIFDLVEELSGPTSLRPR